MIEVQQNAGETAGSLIEYQPMAPPRSQPIVTLTTDFGYRDHYAGTMKGVLLSRCPDAQIVDISHAIPAFSIYQGAYAIAQAAPFFPPGTLHVVVVDPGVGTERKIVLLHACDQLFLAPDNGVLTAIALRCPGHSGRQVVNTDLFLAAVSSTFHGRDVFAPVAGSLASGIANPDDLGPPSETLELLPDWLAQQAGAGQWRGVVLSVDHFGNVITNLALDDLGTLAGRSFRIRAGDSTVSTWAQTFGSAPPNICFAYAGSSGYVELAVKQSSAAAMLKVSPGDPVTLTL